jgi:pyruvate dehydrogenase E2 component (dihydrolipoamide acetyltransferase)
MPIISLRVPQLGEGLHEALLVDQLKRPGDAIQRDEPIYTMETDKATTEVESPCKGVLVQWMAEPGSVLAIGAEIGLIEVTELADGAEVIGTSPTAQFAQSSSQVPSESGSVNSEEPTKQPAVQLAASLHPAESRSGILIPPRTRKYLRDRNLIDQSHRIPTRGDKMMPEDVDAYLAMLGGKPVDDDWYTLERLPKSQLALNFRLSRGAAICVPVTVVTEIDWTRVQAARHEMRDQNGPTGFAIACWAVVQAMKQHPKFRSSLTPDGLSLKIFRHINLGVAVALPNDELVTAVIRQADAMTAGEFFQAYERQVLEAQNGHDQADESTTLTISNIGKVGIRVGIPAIVAPAVATLAFGEAYQQAVPADSGVMFQPTVSATMTFDHRIINGVGAARFIGDIRAILESFQLPSQ